MHFSAPEIWLARSPDLIHWGKHELLCGGRAPWESERVGGATPPVCTDHGWLVLYHGNDRAPGGSGVGSYYAGALLLDSDNPAKVIQRTAEPILAPEAEFEREGYVPNVIFPTGIIDHESRYQLFYGAADECTGVIEVPKDWQAWQSAFAQG